MFTCFVALQQERRVFMDIIFVPYTCFWMPLVLCCCLYHSFWVLKPIHYLYCQHINTLITAWSVYSHEHKPLHTRHKRNCLRTPYHPWHKSDIFPRNNLIFLFLCIQVTGKSNIMTAKHLLVIINSNLKVLEYFENFSLLLIISK